MPVDGDVGTRPGGERQVPSQDGRPLVNGDLLQAQILASTVS